MGSVKFDNNTYTMDELEKKYRKFYAPAFDVIIEGTSLEKDSIAISYLKVETSIKESADSFTFRVDNGYDLVKREFRWLKKYFSIGKYVEIKLGYADKLETVFYGIITSVELDFPADTQPTISVTGMDLSFLMMNNKNSNWWKNKKHSDVVKSIASKYGFKMSVDDTDKTYVDIEQYRTSDFLFITELAEINDYDFFMVGKTLYFRKPKQNTSEVVTLSYGKNLISYSVEMDLANQVSQVVVRGVNEDDAEPLEAKSRKVDILGSNSRTGKDIMKAIADHSTEYVYANVDSVEEAQELADAIMNARSMQLLQGAGESIGLPELRAGRYIKLEGLGDTFNQPIYLTSVVHKVNGSGYLTSFTTGGNAI